jgi:hypothetical protein
MSTEAQRSSRFEPVRWLAALLGACMLLVASPVVRGDALDGTLGVQSAFVNIEDGVYLLQARVQYPVNDQIRAALRDGVSLTFELRAVVERERRFWGDARVVDLMLERELVYHTVSDRYVVRGNEGRELDSYPSLDAALDALGNVDRWPILVASQVAPDADHTVRVRAGVRRGRLTDALRVLLFWTNDWHRETEWYEWSLPR